MTDLVTHHRRRLLELHMDWMLVPGGRCWALSGGSGSLVTKMPQGAEVLDSYFASLRVALAAHDGIREQEDADMAEPLKWEYAVTHEGLSWRVSLARGRRGWHRFLRYMSDDSLDFRTLGYAPALVDILLDKRLDHGLVIFAGAPASGKTTAAHGLVRERLRARGGHAITLEDPPEQNLEGEHGEGYCIQIGTTRNSMSDDLERSVRYGFPSVVLIGELRNECAVAQALREGQNGQLIVTTLHAAGVTEALERIRGFAIEGGHSGHEANDLMASSIAAVVHQQLLPVGEPKEHRLGIPRAGRRMRLSASALLVSPPWASQAVRAQIRDGNFALLVTEMEHQARMLGFPPPC